MTLRELLKQNELRVVEVAAGADGLARTISGLSLIHISEPTRPY